MNYVVPTRVGVNRHRGGAYRRRPGRPHARGGEPLVVWKGVLVDGVVPTRVGVNRLHGARERGLHPSSPHAWG